MLRLTKKNGVVELRSVSGVGASRVDRRFKSLALVFGCLPCLIVYLVSKLVDSFYFY